MDSDDEDYHLDQLFTMQHDYKADLVGAISSIRKTGKYSDLTIVCGEKSFQVHKAIVCPQSGFFDKACGSGFSESFSGKVELQDHPLVVQAMVDYLYTGHYQPSRFGDYPPSALPHNAGELDAQERFWHQDVWLDIHLYVLADRLLIGGLKQLSQRNFKANMQCLPSAGASKSDRLYHIISLIYEPALSPDVALRDVVVNVVVDELRSYHGAALNKLMEKKPKFMYDFTVKLVKQHVDLTITGNASGWSISPNDWY